MLESVLVEVGNFALQACNVGEKGTPFRKLQGNFQILEQYLQRNFLSGFRATLNTFFWIFSKVFGAGVSKHPHENICDGV